MGYGRSQLSLQRVAFYILSKCCSEATETLAHICLDGHSDLLPLTPFTKCHRSFGIALWSCSLSNRTSIYVYIYIFFLIY
jgi:hypothetical protein